VPEPPLAGDPDALGGYIERFLAMYADCARQVRGLIDAWPARLP